ncbi:MAG: GAF domain-containing protein [Anaerolineae bacterium]|nr:GAF domain-containing protein [Anaerolineae bacterium]
MSSTKVLHLNLPPQEQPRLGPTPKSLQIMLIDGEEQKLQPLDEALRAAGYETRFFHNPDEARLYLSRTDVLLMADVVAEQPKSSKLVKAPTILVLTDNQARTLPPWLDARHVSLVPYPPEPHHLIDHLPEYITPRPPNFGIDPTNAEHLALLFGITQMLSGHLDINDLFERILTLAPQLNAHFSALLMQEGDETIYYRSTEPGREELMGSTGLHFALRLLKDGLEGWVLRHNQVALLPNTLKDSRWFRASYQPEQEYCVVALPITLERVEARGVYLVGHKQPGYFTENDVPLLRAAVTQICMAIENAMLFKNQSERSIQLSLINEVSQAATSILNLDVMLRTVVQAIWRSFAFYSVSIHLYQPATQLVRLRAKVSSDRQSFRPPMSQEAPVTHKLRQGLIGWSAATNKTILANDVTLDPRYIPDDHHREIRAELCVPIKLGVKTIGVLDLQSIQLDAFDKYHVSALETLADQLAIAIENARLYDEINQHITELKFLNEIGQAITSTLELEKTLKLITDHTTRLLDVAAASVALRDDENQEVWFAAASGEGSQAVIGLRMPLGQGLAGWVADQGEAVIVPDVYADTRFFAEVDKTSGFTTQSILCVPLQTKGRTIGAIEVMNKKRGTFNHEDQALLQALALSAATAIENAQLYEEQARTIKRLAETQSQLIQSAKLAAVGELAAGAAHEINNPLTTIINLTNLLLDTTAPTTAEERRDDLEMIHAEARRTRNIVRNLLDFARADAPKGQLVDLNQLIEEALLLVYTKGVRQKIELRKQLGTLPQIFLDLNQIKQVIVNLLYNAIQAMQDTQNRPAILTITTRVAEQDSAAATVKRISPGSKNGQEAGPKPVIICEISDTGHGIQPEHLDKIFDPFFTTKEVGQGTGLGLSISYGIVKKHGGDIDVDSTPGQGTTFTLTLSGVQPPDEA